jgi:8-oxo-dGTP pyrophosphatase MutT (NUDIX family)
MQKTRKGPANEHGWTRTPPSTCLSTSVFDVFTSVVGNNNTGKEKPFYGLRFPSWVNIVARTPDRCILLIRQYRFGSDRLELEIPGGAIDSGEEPLAAGLRELMEETGYQGESARIIGKVCPNPALQDNYCYTVLVENVKLVGPPQPDEMEEIEVFPATEEEILNLITTGSIDHGLVLNGLFFYFLSQKKFHLL